MKIKVCVIGAGASGLPAIKSCIENGLEVVCYERTAELGGLWNYRPNQKEGGTVMASTVVNTSKEMMAYSDFVPLDKLPNFMHHSFVLKYMKEYAEKFDLLKYIKFNTEVKTIEKVDGKWKITLGNGRIEIFDKIMLATGHHSYPIYPQFRGMEVFKGQTIHAHDYRSYKGYEGKDVFIVGIGNSALDIAVELSKIAKSVTISTRRGSWIFNRCAAGGMPYDIVFHSRLYYFIRKILPLSLVNDFMEHRLQQRMDHDLFGLRPNHRFFEQHPTVNDALANLLASGMITVTEDVETFEGNAVIVKGGRKFACDELILCTGYTFSFPFLKPQSLIPIKVSFLLYFN
uniref:Flavin-containing monooxygenase n=1 Tax=Panagrolaimus davidi TaxID=227884 RepID=A0A914QKG1_9BILA